MFTSSQFPPIYEDSTATTHGKKRSVCGHPVLKRFVWFNPNSTISDPIQETNNW